MTNTFSNFGSDSMTGRLSLWTYLEETGKWIFGFDSDLGSDYGLPSPEL